MRYKLAIGIVVIIAVLSTGFLIWEKSTKTTTESATTTTVTPKANETIENYWTVEPKKAFGWSDVIPLHPNFTVGQDGNITKVIIEQPASNRITEHCNWDSCNIRNATNYIYDAMIGDGYMDNETVKILVNDKFTVFNGTVYDLRG